MKKIIALSAVLVMGSLGMACGEAPANNANKTNTNAVKPATPATTAPATPATTAPATPATAAPATTTAATPSAMKPADAPKATK